MNTPREPYWQSPFPQKQYLCSIRLGLVCAMTAAMENGACSACLRPKAGISCELCQSLVCKKCAHIMAQDAFAFLESIPPEMQHRNYCPSCFEKHVAEAFQNYSEVMERAKTVFIFNKAKSEQTRLYSKAEKPIKVVDCADKDELYMRMAFTAAKNGFNCLIYVETDYKKIRNFGYHTCVWSGSGIPTLVDAKKLEEEDQFRSKK